MGEKTTKKIKLRQRIGRKLLRTARTNTQLIELLDDAKTKHLIDSDAFHMIKGVLAVSRMQARDIMVPRPKIIAIEDNMSSKIALPIIIDSGHSRYPVIEQGSGKIQGMMLAKDLLKYARQDHNKNIRIKEIIHPIIIIPESKRLDELLKEFRQKHSHMAVIVDEYGNVAGLITIEDILEQIVGNIEDEFDEAQGPDIKPLGNSKYLVKALTPLDDFNNFFNVTLNTEYADTIGGFLLRELSHLPKQGEVINIPPLNIKVVEATRRGIQLLRVLINKEP